MATVIGIGLLAGFLIGSFGVGGVIVAPALTYIAHVDIQLAVAAALMGFALSGVVGTLQYGRKGSIQWSSAWILVVAAVPATIAGSLVMQRTSPLVLKSLVGLAVLSTGVQILIGQRPEQEARAGRLPARHLVIIGAITAFGSVLTGTGGPLLLIPMLVWLHQPVLTAIGLSQVIQLPISLAATATNMVAGAVDFWLGAILAFAMAVGCWFGASVAHQLSEKWLRLGVASLLVLIGVVIVVDVTSQITG